jgi:starch-binding outer membrane protein, SusD/RagB family
MNFSKYILYAVAGLASLSSCSKQLDLKPTDSFNENNAFLTLADAQLGTNAAYGRYGAYLNDMYVSALLADEAKLGFGNNGQGALTYRYQFNADATAGGDVTGAYPGYYVMIDQANRVLEKLPLVTASASEEPRRNVLKGQLLALRAIAHFGLLQAYCKVYDPATKGVPVMVKSDPAAKPARNTMGEVMTRIETDLNDAFALLPAVTPANFTDTVINQVNINAYRARIALYKKDYANAITYSSAVISSAVKPLALSADFPGIWTDININETLFRIRYSTGANVGSLWTTTGGLIYIAPSDKLVATYATADIRKAAYIGTNAGNNYVNKFFTSSRGGRIVDLKACRISEMYLIRAEAYAKLATPNIVSGTADLNVLRAQRITGYVNQTFVTATDLINAVLDERYKELCFEGFRFFDLKRNGLPVQRNLSDVTSATWQTLLANDYKMVLPIPQAEILANPNTIQNDGY